MKHLRVILILAALTLAAFSVAAAQDATATPLPETAAPEATTVPETAEQAYFGIQFEAAEGGVAVADVMPGSPADTAGIEPGDVVTAIGGTAVTEDNVRETVQGFAVGDTVSVDITRGEETLTVDVTLAAAPLDLNQPGRPDVQMFRMERPRLGVTIEDSDAGVVVTAVAEGSPAESVGLLVDDVITAVNGTAVASAEETVSAVAAAVDAAEVGEFDVTVSVTRGEESLELTATLVKPDMPLIPQLREIPGMRGDRGGRGFGMPGLGMGGFNLVPREGVDGAFDLVVPFRPADPAAVTDEVTAALADLGIRIVPRDGEEGLFDLYVPAETLGEMEGGFILPHLGMFEGMEGMLPEGFEFHFGGPLSRNFEFNVPDLVIPTVPAPEGEGSA